MAARDSVLVTGAYGSGRQARGAERLVSDGFKVHRHRAPRVEAGAACRRRRAVGRSDEAGSGQCAYRRGHAVGDCSSGSGHPSALLCQPSSGPSGERRRDCRACGAAQAQPSPPRFVHASSMAVYGSRNPHRSRPTCSPPIPRCWRRTCTAATRSWPKTSSAHRIWSGQSFGLPASPPSSRWSTTATSIVLFRGDDARGQPVSLRRRPRCRRGVLGRSHHRCRAGDLHYRRRRLP